MNREDQLMGMHRVRLAAASLPRCDIDGSLWPIGNTKTFNLSTLSDARSLLGGRWIAEVGVAPDCELEGRSLASHYVVRSWRVGSTQRVPGMGIRVSKSARYSGISPMEALGEYGSDSGSENGVSSSYHAASASSESQEVDEVKESLVSVVKEERLETLTAFRGVRVAVGRDFHNPQFVRNHLREMGLDEHGTNFGRTDPRSG